MSNPNDIIVQNHYKRVADEYGPSPHSTMEDSITRQREVDFILNFLSVLKRKAQDVELDILDLGCGNGYTMGEVVHSHPNNHYWGLDFSEDLLAIARSRNLPGCELLHGDVRSLDFGDNTFHAIYTERCLINLLSWDEQAQALGEIARVLKPGGYYLMIEAFTDGWENCNRARTECGLPEIPQAHHNRYFDKDETFPLIHTLFDVIEADQFDPEQGIGRFPQNFLSSHYFVARVLHALVTNGGQAKNTEFVKFFSFFPPVGNYSPIQAYILKKKS